MLKKILFVATDSNIHNTLKAILHEQGIDVKNVESGHEALEMLLADTFDLVIANLPIPDMDGLELTKCIRIQNDDTQIIVITDSAALNRLRQAFFDSQEFDYFWKPLDNIENLVKSIYNALRERDLILESKRLRGELKQAKTALGQENALINTRKRIQKSKKLLQCVFDGIKDVLIMVDQDMKIKAINKAAWEYFNLPRPKDSIGKPCYLIIAKKKTPCEDCKITSIMKTGKPLIFERKGMLDTDKWEQVAVYPIKENSEVSGAIVRITDITVEKNLEKEMIQAEKLASLGFLISGISHEINGPNNLISFNVPILRDYLQELIPIIDDCAENREDFRLFGMSYDELRKDIFKLLDNIHHGSKRISKIVDELREFIIDRDRFEVRQIDLREVLNKAITISGDKIKKMVKHFELNIPDKSFTIFSNPEALEQIIINFLINAAQSADKEDSWIKIDVKKKKSDPDFIFIEVSDNGCGIDQETLKRIFDPFFTTKIQGKGTGLGLFISHIMANNMGARIEVESAPGKGSKFTLIVPMGY